jgi:AraC family transcriptional regulator of arabinose operon
VWTATPSSLDGPKPSSLRSEENCALDFVRHGASMAEIESGGVRDRRIKAALSAVNADLAKPWTALEMARLVNLSVSRFNHLFVEEVGRTPAQFLLEIRLVEAHRLLSRTFLTVKEASIRVGVSDRSYFNRVFKRQFGCPPGQVRLRADAQT